MQCKSAGKLIVALLTLCALQSCASVRSQGGWLAIDYYHVRFEPSGPDLTPAQRSVEADAWRTQIRAVAARVAETVSDSNVYGDTALWDAILEADESTVTRCRATNTTDRSLDVIPGQSLMTQAAIQAVDLSHGEIPGVGPCTVPKNRRLRTLDLIAATLRQAQPKSNLVGLEVRVGPAGNKDLWKELDFATLSVTYDPAVDKGAAQFAFVVVLQRRGWRDDFEEVLIVPRGTYFGDA